MKPSTLKQRWASGKPVINGWLSMGSPFGGEIMAAAGYDSLTIDLQHGIADYSHAVPILQAIAASGVCPLTRVPWLDPGIIMKMLDAGAYGIICPMINNRAQAELLVSSMRYPPRGTRSFGPTRANFSAGANYAAEANEQVVCLAMIETAEAVANLKEITTTPGLDGVYIGPADLTLGVTNGRLAPGFDRKEPEMDAVIKQILKAASDAGIAAGIHCGAPEYAVAALGWGFKLATISNDVRLMAGAANASVARTRELLGEQITETGSSGGY